MAQVGAQAPAITFFKPPAQVSEAMVWLPDWKWEQQKKKGGGGNDLAKVLQLLMKTGGGGGGGGGGKWGGKKQWRDIKEKDTGGGEIGEYKGTIENKGWKFGFITCPQLKNKGGPKVFVLGDEFKNFAKGHSVKFTAYLDSEGRLQGKNLMPGK